MDFIEQLPTSSSFTAILVVIDQLSKQSIFIPTHDTITSLELMKLFLLHMFSKHGVPTHVTSDQGTELISHFFQSLGKALTMHLHFTSGYHLEGARPSNPTKHSNSTSDVTAITSRTTGQNSCHSQSSCTIMHLVQLLEFPPSSQTKVITLISQFIQNAI